MPAKFKVGDHVTWNSEAGHVRGRIIKIHTKNVDYKGYTHHASPDEPQYEIASDKTDHVAMHKGTALRKVDSRNRSQRRSDPASHYSIARARLHTFSTVKPYSRNMTSPGAEAPNRSTPSTSPRSPT